MTDEPPYLEAERTPFSEHSSQVTLMVSRVAHAPDAPSDDSPLALLERRMRGEMSPYKATRHALKTAADQLRVALIITGMQAPGEGFGGSWHYAPNLRTALVSAAHVVCSLRGETVEEQRLNTLAIRHLDSKGAMRGWSEMGEAMRAHDPEAADPSAGTRVALERYIASIPKLPAEVKLNGEGGAVAILGDELAKRTGNDAPRLLITHLWTSGSNYSHGRPADLIGDLEPATTTAVMAVRHAMAVWWTASGHSPRRDIYYDTIA